MPTFRYTAADAHDQPISGEVVAVDADSARRQLAARGLVSIALTAADETGAPSSLSARGAEHVAMVLAEVSDSQLPLASGLRAASLECTDRRVAAALRKLAADVESGYSLESIMAERADYLPSHVRGLIIAGARTNRLGLALDELVEHHRAMYETRSEIMASFAYPTIVLVAALALLAAMPFVIVPPFEQLFLELEIDLPALTESLIGVSDVVRWLVIGPGKWLSLAALALLVVVFAFARIMLGNGWIQTLSGSVPLLGPMWKWNGTAAFARLLATLLEHDVPLTQALALVGDGIPSPAYRATAKSLADGAAQGRSLSEMLFNTQRMPASIVPFIYWGEQTGRLPEALRTMNQMLLGRVRIRALVIRSIGPPVIFIVVALMIGYCVLSLSMPLVSLIQNLS